MSEEKRKIRAANENRDVLEIVDSILEPRVEEPWASSSMVVANLLHPRQVYVSRYTKKQIRFLSEAVSVLHVVRRYLGTDVTWLEALLREYTRLNKYEDGWVIKEAVRVAGAAQTRMMFNLSRVKRILFGAESESE